MESPVVLPEVDPVGNSELFWKCRERTRLATGYREPIEDQRRSFRWHLSVGGLVSLPVIRTGYVISVSGAGGVRTLTRLEWTPLWSVDRETDLISRPILLLEALFILGTALGVLVISQKREFRPGSFLKMGLGLLAVVAVLAPVRKFINVGGFPPQYDFFISVRPVWTRYPEGNALVHIVGIEGVVVILFAAWRALRARPPSADLG